MIILHSHGVGRGVQAQSNTAADNQTNAMERLSTGSRINHAQEDAARLGLSDNLRAHSMSKRAALRNLQDGLSITQSAEGGLQGISEVLKRARTMAVQASSETLTSTERAYCQNEFARALEDIDDISKLTKYNDIPLLQYATVDVGLLVDVSNSMNGEISQVTAEINNFVATLGAAHLEAGLGLASMGPDIQDGITRLANIADGDFGAELSNLSIQGQLSMDPYAALMQASGASDFPGITDPDAFAWRDGAKQKALVVITDTFRETSLYSGFTGQAATATAMQNEEVEVHTINRPAHNSDYSPITSASGGSTHDIGDTSGSLVGQALTDIADSLSDEHGITALGVQSSHQSGTASVIEIDLPVNATVGGLGLTASSVATTEDARTAIGEIDDALTTVSGYRSIAAATGNRIQQAIDAETRAKADVDRAGEQIVSADIASETAEAARQQTKTQATQAIMAQSVRLQRLAIDSLLNDKQ